MMRHHWRHSDKNILDLNEMLRCLDKKGLCLSMRRTVLKLHTERVHKKTLSRFLSLDETRMRADESWQARVCMQSVSSTLIAQRSNEQWELHESLQESIFLFSFCSLLPRFFFFVFWRLCQVTLVSSVFDASVKWHSKCHLSMIRNNILY